MSYIKAAFRGGVYILYINPEPWIKARVTPVLVIKMGIKSLGGWRALSAQGDGEPHVRVPR